MCSSRDLGITSYAPDGERRWRLKLQPFSKFLRHVRFADHYGNTLVLVCDQKREAFILALDKDTGRVRWRKERAQAKTEAFSTPVIWTSQNGKAQVIVAGAYRIDGYTLDTGENVWWVSKPGTSPVSTPVLDNGLIFATSWGAERNHLILRGMQYRGNLIKTRTGRFQAGEAAANPELGDHFGWADRNGDGFLASRRNGMIFCGKACAARPGSRATRWLRRSFGTPEPPQ